ncbi:hypothetical protein FSF30_008410 [Escherichia coli]|nr:hypothetical protein [Escherichia coli]
MTKEHAQGVFIRFIDFRGELLLRASATTIDKHRSEKDAHHIYLTDGTYFCATNVARVNLIRQVQDPRK